MRVCSSRATKLTLGEGGASLFDGGDVAFGPEPNAAEGFAERFAERREGVVDMRRDNGVDGAADEAVLLHLAESLGEHFLADGGDEAAEVLETDNAVFVEGFKDEHGPFVGDAVNGFADECGDLGIEFGVSGGGRGFAAFGGRHGLRSPSG